MDFAKHVRETVDIVRVVGEYVRLKKSGTRHVGLCPFHTEKTPSFSVNPDHQIFICFGCGEKGDVFTFLMKIEGMTFVEALHSLAERNGIPIPERRHRAEPQAELRDALLAMHQIAAETFQANLRLPAGSDARGYCNKRGLTPLHVETFGIGLSDRSGQDLTRKLQKQFSPEQLQASGLVLRREDGTFFDRFRGRLMFPIHNQSGKVIAFGGRALQDGDEPKYLNSAKTELYDKSSVLYNLNRARASIRNEDFAVLVEGYMDVIGVYSAGVQNVVASCGTALTSQHVRVLRNYSNRITVNFDSDAAGASAAEKYIEMLLEEGMRVRVLELDGDLDPDEYIRTHGVERYYSRLESAPGYFLWIADRARRKFDMRTSEGRMAGLNFLLPSIRKITDKIERAAVAEEVAAYLNIERGLVLDEFRKGAVERQKAPQMPRQPEVPRNERILLRSLLSDRGVREVLVPALRQSSAVKKFDIQPILNMIFVLQETDPDFAYGDIEGRLDEKGKQMLAIAVLGDDSEETLSVEQASAYLRVLEQEEKQASVSTMRLRIREAERKGNLELAFQLMDELTRMQRG